jgi:hypothetical protein
VPGVFHCFDPLAPKAESLFARDKTRRTILHRVAARDGAQELVKLVLSANPSVLNSKDCQGNNPWHSASFGGAATNIAAMVTAMACGETTNHYYKAPEFDVRCKSFDEANLEGWAPIHACVERVESLPHAACLRNLASFCRANMNVRRAGDGGTIAHMSVINEDEDGLRACIALGTSPRTRNAVGRSAGDLATYYRLPGMRDICDLDESERLSHHECIAPLFDKC